MPSEHEDRLDSRIEGLILSHELLALDLKSMAAENRALGALVADIGVGTARLLRAVESHEQRVSRLEDGEN